MKVVAAGVLWLLVKINLGLRCLARRWGRKEPDLSVGGSTNPNFSKFQRQYFVPHYVALFGDWLQAPYLYNLYSSYGFEEEQIATLYACGLVAALLLSAVGLPTVAGSMGRRSACVVAALAYATASLMYMSHNYGILLIGRILSGASATALFQSLEAWCTHEHLETHDFPREWLALTFASASYWSSVIAVAAGLVAYVMAEILSLGPVAPFVLAAPVFITTAVIIGLTWKENYGRPHQSVRGSDVGGAIGSGSGTGLGVLSCGFCSKTCLDSLREIGENRRLLLLGVIQALFESVVYVFVFLWTPVLSTPASAAAAAAAAAVDVSGDDATSAAVSPMPLGIVFSAFMVCTMIGASLAELAETRSSPPRGTVLLLAATGALGASVTCTLFSGHAGFASTPSSATTCFVAYLLYQCSAGIYFSVMGRLRQQAAPDAEPAAVAALGWFRLPMNLIACALLMLMHDDSFRHGNRLIFAVCSSLLLGAVLCCVSYLPLDRTVRSAGPPQQLPS